MMAGALFASVFRLFESDLLLLITIVCIYYYSILYNGTDITIYASFKDIKTLI